VKTSAARRQDSRARLVSGHMSHPGLTGRGRAGIERGRHQVMPVEAAMEVQRLPVVPATPDGPQGRDELGHPFGGTVERRPEPPRDVRADLRAEADRG
jgi:hypothetical protein